MKAGEFELIDKIRRRVKSGDYPGLGIGDDCSSIAVPPEYELVTSTDLLLESVHFRLDWTDFYSLGIKAVAVNVSDIAAMGARPVSIHLAVGLPAEFGDQQIDQFLDGIFAGLDRYEVTLVGGDTCKSSGLLVISITAQGLCHKDRLVTRGGAKGGDDLWVSGTLGDSALALRLLQQQQPLSEFLQQRHHRPEARIALGQYLGDKGLATAMLDLSDGIDGDLCHLLKASGTGARLELAKLPLSPEFRVALQKDETCLDLALCGGEDYELLFTAKPEMRSAIETLSRELNLSLQPIGEITSESGLEYIGTNGLNYQPQSRAFDHFGGAKDRRCE